MYRSEARRNLRSYRDHMKDYMNSKSSLDFNVGDIVAVKIPSKDRFKTDRPNLICKITEKLPKNNYKLGCKFGMLDISYNGNNLEPVKLNNLPELENIPAGVHISVRTTSRMQNMPEVEVSDIRCGCKKTFCSTLHCNCRKAGKRCNINCHPDNNDCNNPP